MNTTTFTNAFADYSIADKKELRRGRVIRAIREAFGKDSFTISELRSLATVRTSVFSWVSLTHEVNSKYVREQLRSLIKSLELVKVGTKNTGKGGRMENAYCIPAVGYHGLPVNNAKSVLVRYGETVINPVREARMVAVMRHALRLSEQDPQGHFDSGSLFESLHSEIAGWVAQGMEKASVRNAINTMIKEMGIARVGSKAHASGAGRPFGVYAIKVENLTKNGETAYAAA